MNNTFTLAKEYLPEAEKGDIIIRRFSVSKHQSNMSSLSVLGHVPKGDYTQLLVGGRIMMSDTPQELSSNSTIIFKANGNVLIAGLGMGLIVVPILKKDEVKSVTVIETNKDVIDLVEPHIKSEKLTVIYDDIFEWKPAKGVLFDTIYFDIWPDICTDNLDDIKKLNNKFKFRLNRENPDCWRGAWMEDTLKYLRRKERAEDRRWGRY